MNDIERKVHIGNYCVSKEILTQALSQFGPVRVRDPFQPKVPTQAPYGFATFDKEADAKACLAARRVNVDGQTVLISAPKPTSKPSQGSNSGGNFGGLSFGGSSSLSQNSLAQDSSMSKLASGDAANSSSQQNLLKFRAILSHTNGINELYVQNISGARAADYLNLQDQLIIHCQSAAVVSNPQPGQMYAGLFSEDGAWYRCTVKNVEPNGSYLVQFIDYGNQSEVQPNHLKDLSGSMLTIPPAAVKYHLKGLVAKPECADKVAELLQPWHEILLQCEAAADDSIDLINQETQASLRTTLITSGFVKLGSQQPVAGKSGSVTGNDTDGDGSPRGKAKKNKRNKESHKLAADNADAEAAQKKTAEAEAALLEAQEKYSALKKQSDMASKKIAQLEERKSIDQLNKVLYDKLATVKTLRSKFPSSLTDGLLNHAISLLEDSSYTTDTHNDIFNSVNDVYVKYKSLQERIRRGDSIDEEMITERNETKQLFCESVKECQEKCDEMKASERRIRLNEVLVKLAELYPHSGEVESDGDLMETIAVFKQWQTEEGGLIKSIQRSTDEALDALSQQFTVLQQALKLEVNINDAPEDHKLELTTTLAIAALAHEIESANSAQGAKMVESLYAALIEKIGDEFKLLEQMHIELNRLQGLVSSIEPTMELKEPERMDWYQERERKLKELRSKLRHSLADMEDLRETDDASEEEITDMERRLDDVRNEIHSVLMELEGYLENLAELASSVYPEFAIRYPKLHLRSLMDGKTYIKPLRDITFYKDNGNTETTFNGTKVVLKTLSHQQTSEQNLVEKIAKSDALRTYINVDAVFFSKNQVNMYIQLSSEHEQITAQLRDVATLDLKSLTEFVNTFRSDNSLSTNVTPSPSTTDITSTTEELSDTSFEFNSA